MTESKNWFPYSYSLDIPDQPAAKKLRRSASVVIDQPGDNNKVLIDHVGDSVTSLEDVRFFLRFKYLLSCNWKIYSN